MHINLLNQFQNGFYVNAGRGQQVIGQRLAFKLGGFRVTTADFNNFTHQRVTVGVRAAGAERNQYVAVSHF